LSNHARSVVIVLIGEHPPHLRLRSHDLMKAKQAPPQYQLFLVQAMGTWVSEKNRRPSSQNNPQVWFSQLSNPTHYQRLSRNKW
jgi:hypothetical protein